MAVRIDVAGGADSRTEVAPRGSPGEGQQQGAGRARPDVGTTGAGLGAGAAGAPLRCAYDDVVNTVAVDVTRVGDGIAEVLPRLADVSGEHEPGAARPDVNLSRVGAGGRRVERRADDRVRDMITVDVAELAHRPAIVLAWLAADPGVHRRWHRVRPGGRGRCA